jgi:hypothetical protein
MGQISQQLAARFQLAVRQFDELVHEAKNLGTSNQIPGDVKSIEQCVDLGMDPLHAAYASLQNFVSLFAQAISSFDELDAYYQIVAKAEDEYIPEGPPISPLTTSYFTTWAFFDVRFGPDRETVGTCLLDIAPQIGIDDATLEIVQGFQQSRMGIYEHVGMEGPRCILRDLVTAKEFKCHVASGYTGKAGELWYVRLCPPLFDLFDYHLAFTTPYILINATQQTWTAYLKKSLIGATDEAPALHDFLKYGPSPNHWNEFIFQAYHHHKSDAIFLAGLPDVKASRPYGNLARDL